MPYEQDHNHEWSCKMILMMYPVEHYMSNFIWYDHEYDHDHEQKHNCDESVDEWWDLSVVLS